MLGMLAVLYFLPDMDERVDVRSKRSYRSAYSIYFDNYLFYPARGNDSTYRAEIAVYRGALCKSNGDK
jgi:hypothetical protein